MLLYARKLRSWPSRSLSSYLLSLLAFSSATQFTSAAKCYFTDGSEADSSHEPCFPDQEFSPCCAINKPEGSEPDVCLSSGLCYAQQAGYTGQIYQNSCTDQSWSSSDCPRICPGFSIDDGIQVLPCPTRGQWCCLSSDHDNCCDDSSPLGIGTLIIPTPTYYSCPLQTATAPVPTKSHETAKPKITPASGNNTTANSKCNGPDPTAVGAGVGGGLGVCLLMALGALWWQGRRYHRKLREAAVVATPLDLLDSKKAFYSSSDEREDVPIVEAPGYPPIHEISGTETTRT